MRSDFGPDFRKIYIMNCKRFVVGFIFRFRQISPPPLPAAPVAASWPLNPGVQQSHRSGPSMSPRCGRLATLNPGVQQSHRSGPSMLPRCGLLATFNPGVQPSHRSGPPDVATLRPFVATLRPCGPGAQRPPPGAAAAD